LTTGDLTETCIFLGTDDHNVRTTTDGKVQITTGGQFNICTIQTAGSGYTSGTTIPAQTTGGTGTGMTVNFGYGISGQLVSVSVANPGTGYTNGDVITVGGGTGTFVLTRYNDFANQGNNNSLQSAWDFSADGTLTLPGSYNSRITEDAPGVVVYSDYGFALVASASTPVASYAVEFTGFVDNGAGESGATLHVTAMIAGTITNGMTVFGSSLPPEGLTLAFGGVSGTAGDGGVGNYSLTGANLLLTSQSFNNGVIAPAGPKTWMFDDEGDITLPEDGDIVNGDGESFLKDIPQNYPTDYTLAPYVLQANDRGRHILIDGSEGTSIEVPTDAAVPMPIGSTIVLVIKPGPYSIVVVPEDLNVMSIHGAGVGSNMDYQLDAGTGGAMATLIKIGANEWMISGTGLAEYTGP
jgi:hypothetical protein